MIWYLDSSALVKLYLEEEDHDQVREWVAVADAVVTSVAAYPEVRAVLAAAGRARRLGRSELNRAVTVFDADWAGLGVYPLTPELALAAGEVAQRYGLRGYDSVHLATWIHAVRHNPGAEVRFGCFDRNLLAGAAAWRRAAANG